LLLLASRHARAVARDALVAIGEPALDALAAALQNPELPRELRAHLPRSISRFASPRAADIMLDRLEQDRDGWVRFKLIRGLAQLRPFMQEAPRTRRALALARTNLVHAVHFMSWRLANERDQQHDPRLATPGGELLTTALHDKEWHATDRALRLLGLLHNADVFHNIRQALASRDARLRADGIELLLHGAPTEIARALAALLEHGHDESRLARAAEALDERVTTDSYEQRLERMLSDNSEAVRAVAGYHMAELGLRLPATGQRQSLPLAPLRVRAGELFDQLRAGARRPEPAS
jgi:HEAT repeat protein